ncbi:hypothetical protein [Streptomyces fuscichromogenes]|uniref:Uncharacterized protein n=1 Tax=Streptomyces fuscichromogenes TaxID=1324013 RepID=A0A917XAL8_9ACTN|nr:hypothetical protein [Streptomyces fuscichromogenes]GGN01608.1 hypothetical protein GCM10011578_023780 [Streptomyces fuscichromogenes]
MIDSTDVLRALGARGTVQWSRISVGRDPLDSLVRPPMVVWRYRDPHDRVRAQFQRISAQFDGAVEWTVDLSAKNWVIMTRRLKQEFAQAAPGYTGVLSDLKNADQDFCIRATADLGSLLEIIRKP